MSSDSPAQRLHRRLGHLPDSEDADGEPADDDTAVLLPSWLPAGSAAGEGWLTRLRADPGRSGAIALGLVALIAVLVTIFTLVRTQQEPVMSAKLPPVQPVSSSTPASAQITADSPVIVSVVGLVQKPGVVTLAPGARVADAVAAAGGALDGADNIGLNLAQRLTDGEQVVVGLAPLPDGPHALGSSVGGSTSSASAPTKSSAPTTGAAGGLVNLNTATVEQLDTLPGVGPVTAAAIVSWRDQHGAFGSVDQLGEVDGIGPARLEKLRALVAV